MKYIRTKDRIYKVVEEYETNDENGNKVFDGCIVKGDYIPSKAIISMADTIEELIDEIIVSNKKYHSPFLKLWGKELIDQLLREAELTGSVFYGAIWTFSNDGVPLLITVVKMNDYGEWELLCKKQLMI